MSKTKITVTLLSLVALFVFGSIVESYDDANANRERLEGIEKGVVALMRLAERENKTEMIDALYNIQEKIDSIYGRIDEEVLESAFLGNESAVCQYKHYGMKEAENAYIKSGKIAGSEEGEDGKGYFLFKDTFLYIWDENMDKGMKDDAANYMFSNSQKSLKEELLDEIKDDLFDCRYELVGDSVFEIPEDVDFVGFEEISEEMIETSTEEIMIKNQLSMIRSLAEANYSFGDGYKEFAEMKKDGGEVYTSIKENIEDHGGELNVKFSKDFGEEDYRNYCAYSPLGASTDKVFCVDSFGNALEVDINESSCVMGITPRCSQ